MAPVEFGRHRWRPAAGNLQDRKTRTGVEGEASRGRSPVNWHGRAQGEEGAAWGECAWTGRTPAPLRGSAGCSLTCSRLCGQTLSRGLLHCGEFRSLSCCHLGKRKQKEQRGCGGARPDRSACSAEAPPAGRKCPRPVRGRRAVAGPASAADSRTPTARFPRMQGSSEQRERSSLGFVWGPI